MSKTIRITLITILSIILLFVIAVISINYIVKGKIENFLQHRLPATVSQTHDELILDTFEGTVTLVNPIVSIKNSDNDSIHTRVSLEKLIIEDVSYWDYLFNGEIHIEDIKLKTPNIVYYTHQYKKTTQDTLQRGMIDIFKPIIIDELSIDNTTFHMYDHTRDSLLLYVENATIEIDDILVNRELIKRRLPLQFRDYQLEADSLFLKSNAYEVISCSDIRLKERYATIKDIHLKTKYSETQLSSIIPKERDHFNLSIPQINIDGIDFGFENRKLFFESTLIELIDPDLDIYRDKLVADDTRRKKMYSQMLRDLPIALTVDTLRVQNGHLEYTERTKEDNMGGVLTFSNMNSTITKLSNTYPEGEQTTIATTAQFMEVSPIDTEWNFDVNNTQDHFTFTLDATNLPATELNPFTEPNLRLRLTGELEKNYMTIDGNRISSHFDMRLKYDDFKIEVLRDNGKKKNWLLSTVANIFVAKDSRKDADAFRESSGEVTRDPTKSIFNYFWLNTKEGLLKGMTGSN